LLLLFAAVPSVILTVIGYYLAVDTSPVVGQIRSAGADEVEGYFLDVFYRDIESALARIDTASVAGETLLDFYVKLDSSGREIAAHTGSLSAGALENLTGTARRQERGLVESDRRLLQFATRKSTSGDLLVGGVAHDSTLVRLLESARLSSATRSAERELHSRYIVFLGLLFLTVTAIAIIAAYLFSSRVSQNLAEPVVALSRAAGQIAAGDFKQEVKVAAQDELGALVESFNSMAAHLDETTARLAQSERVAAWRHVARRFAHELKNPLQPILVSLYRIEQQMSGSTQWDQIKTPLRAASEEVKHLTALAERFSSLAKLPPPTITPLNLNALITSTLELYAEKLKPFSIQVSLPDQPLTVNSDSAYLREAVHNLLQNAVDACREGDQIRVDLSFDMETVEIAVADTGMGMNAATLASARLPYFTTKAKGSGLGLAIVERSMAELGGQLRVESRENEGTRVNLILPRGEAACRPES